VLAECAFSMLATGTEPTPEQRMRWPTQLFAGELPHPYTFDTAPTCELASSLLCGPLHTWSRLADKTMILAVLLLCLIVVGTHFLDKGSSVIAQCYASTSSLFPSVVVIVPDIVVDWCV